MGAHQGRDSISITETEKQKELVLPTEITNLKNLHIRVVVKVVAKVVAIV
jgi:hypothetical protein